MRERRLFDGGVVGELTLPRGATVLSPGEGDVITKRIQGKGYDGGHNTAIRLGWETSYPIIPKGTLAYWDVTLEGTWQGCHPAYECVLPFTLAEVKEQFLVDLRRQLAWYSRPDQVERTAAKLSTCLANGVRFTPEEAREIGGRGFSLVGPTEKSAAAEAAWERALALLTASQESGNGP